MIWLRNPVLMIVCLLLLANLLFNRQQWQPLPHARPKNFQARADHGTPSLDIEQKRAGDAAYGQVLYASSCTSCHGSFGHGMPRQGANLRDSRFIAEHSDAQLVAFLQQGRAAGDPTSVMGLLMPPRGGNRTLDDEALGDIVAFLRALQDEAKHEAAEQDALTASSPDPAPALPATTADDDDFQPVAGIAR